MTGSTSPQENPDALYARLMRERYGDLDKLAAEATTPVAPILPREHGKPRVNVRPPISAPVRTPAGAGRYADDHARVLRWIGRSHPEWHQQLCVIGKGGVAHVLTARGPTNGWSLCGKGGEAFTASDTLPVCRVCTA